MDDPDVTRRPGEVQFVVSPKLQFRMALDKDAAAPPREPVDDAYFEPLRARARRTA